MNFVGGASTSKTDNMLRQLMVKKIVQKTKEAIKWTVGHRPHVFYYLINGKGKDDFLRLYKPRKDKPL